MTDEPRHETPYRTDKADYCDMLTTIFTLMCPDAGQVEWILDRIEGAATWA